MKTSIKLIIAVLVISFFSVSNAYSKGKPKDSKEKKIEVKLIPNQEATVSLMPILNGKVSGDISGSPRRIFCWRSANTCFNAEFGWAMDPFGDGFDYHIADVVPVIDPQPGDQYNIDNTRPAQ